MRMRTGATPEEVAENVQAYLEQGYRYIRVQMGGYGGKTDDFTKPDGLTGRSLLRSARLRAQHAAT